jgi:hypothetical protein
MDSRDCRCGGLPPGRISEPVTSVSCDVSVALIIGGLPAYLASRSSRSVLDERETTMKLVEKSFMRLLLFGAMVAAITMQSGRARAQQATAAAGGNDVTAIDILLDPDATMIQHAQAANGPTPPELPEGFRTGRHTHTTYLNAAAVCQNSRPSQGVRSS